MIVSSGTAGHAHAYWTLRTRVGAVELEQANRTLASHLGGDLASVDAARILRPAGTLSHKHRPPAPVELLHLDPAAQYELAELVDGLTPAAFTTDRGRRRPGAGCAHRTRRAAARDPRRHLRSGARRARAAPQRQGQLPVPCRRHPQPPPLRGRHLLLLRVRRRRQSVRLRGKVVGPRHEGARVSRAPRAAGQRISCCVRLEPPHHGRDHALHQTRRSATATSLRYTSVPASRLSCALLTRLLARPGWAMTTLKL